MKISKYMYGAGTIKIISYIVISKFMFFNNIIIQIGTQVPSNNNTYITLFILIKDILVRESSIFIIVCIYE